jgi:multiple sugar transport system permease protein
MRSISKKHRQQAAGQVALHAALIVVGILFVLPFLWMFLSSFKPALEVIKIPPTFFPRKFILGNYQTIFERLKFWRYFVNSILVSGSITLLAVLTSSLAGFVFTKFKFPGKEVIFVIFLAGLMIPFSIIVMPLYLFISNYGMQNSYLGLILPLCVSPFGIFLMRQFMEGIPGDLVEAARMDGANNLWIYYRVIVPLSAAGMGAVAVFTFLWSWNQLWWPLMVISKEALRTLPLGVAALAFQHGKRFEIIVTGASLAVLPVMVVFIFAQRTLVKGMVLTGLKM